MKKSIKQICIIGMPGSGKSTIGRILSEKINYKFYDTDENIEKTTNLSIKEIFKIKGEMFFREIEKKEFKKLMIIDNVIISTGGGIILNNENLLKKSFNIYLECKLDILIQRASRNQNRPLLLEDIEKKMKKLFNQRKDIYNSLSDLKIDTNYNIKKAIDNILNKLPNDIKKKH